MTINDLQPFILCVTSFPLELVDAGPNTAYLSVAGSAAIPN